MLLYKYITGDTQREERTTQRMNAGEKSFLKALDQGGITALVDQYGNYVYVNKLWEKETGISAGQALGRNVEEIIPGSGAMLALRTGRMMSGEMFLRSKAGKEIASVMKYQPVLDEEGNISGCLITSLFRGLDEAQDFTKKMDQILEEFEYLNSPGTQTLPGQNTAFTPSSEKVPECRR